MNSRATSDARRGGSSLPSRVSSVTLAGALVLATVLAPPGGTPATASSSECAARATPITCTVTVGSDVHVFFAGSIAQVGIRPNGAFGHTTANSTLESFGFSPTSSGLGLVADRKRDGSFTEVDGDFFMPGSPYEGWALRVGATTFYNNNTRTDIAGTFAMLVDGSGGGTHSVTWQSSNAFKDANGIVVTKVYSLADASQRVRVEVTIENTSGAPLTDVYYGRGVDPDNDSYDKDDEAFVTLVNDRTSSSIGLADIDSRFRSLNTVVANPSPVGTGTFAQVSAAFPGGATLSLIANDTTARASRQIVGGFDVNDLDLSDAWTGTASGAKKHDTAVGSVGYADQGMNMTFKFDAVAVDETASFEYSYILSDVDLVAAGGTPTGTNAPPVPVTPTTNPESDPISVPIAVAIRSASELSGTDGVVVRRNVPVPLVSTTVRTVGPRGGLVLEDDEGTLKVTISTAAGVSPTAGVVVPTDGEIVCEVCARLAAGSVVEAWVLSDPRLAAAVRVEVDGEDEEGCPLLRIPVGTPLDGGGAIEPGAHTLQLRMYTEDGFEVLAVPITIGRVVPTSVPSGEGPGALRGSLDLLLAGLALAALGLVVARRRTGATGTI